MRTTSEQILFCVILWLVIYLYSWILYRRKYLILKSSYLCYALLAILFSTFAYYSGDYINYKLLYNESLGSFFTIHMEPIYFWLIKMLPPNYSLWRFVVWGSAILIWIFVYKRLKIKPQYACLATTLILLFTFPNFRQSLAFSIFFLGVTFILYPIKGRFFSYLIAAILIWLSLYFHKSILMFIVLYVLAFIPFNKKLIIASFLLFPVLYGAIMAYADGILGMVFSSDSMGYEFGTFYLESEKGQDLTIWGWLQMVVTRGPVLYAVLSGLWLIYFKGEKVATFIKPFLKYTYILLYIGFLFFGQKTSSFLSSRCLDLTFYPLVIYIAYSMNYQRNVLKQGLILKMFLLSNMYLFAYSLYLKM